MLTMPGVIGIEEMKLICDEVLHLHLVVMCDLHNIETYTMMDAKYACPSIDIVSLLTFLQNLR